MKAFKKMDDAIPWGIIGYAAFAKNMMDKFPDNHPIHLENKKYFENLCLLAQELDPPPQA